MAAHDIDFSYYDDIDEAPISENSMVSIQFEFFRFARYQWNHRNNCDRDTELSSQFRPLPGHPGELLSERLVVKKQKRINYSDLDERFSRAVFNNENIPS